MVRNGPKKYHRGRQKRPEGYVPRKRKINIEKNQNIIKKVRDKKFSDKCKTIRIN